MVSLHSRTTPTNSNTEVFPTKIRGCPGSRSPPGPAVTGSPPSPEVVLPKQMPPSQPLCTACRGSGLGKDPPPWKTMGREVTKAPQLESQSPLGWRRGSPNPRGLVINSPPPITMGSALADLTNCHSKLARNRNYERTEHTEFSSSLFLKQHDLTPICIAFPLYEVWRFKV